MWIFNETMWLSEVKNMKQICTGRGGKFRFIPGSYKMIDEEFESIWNEVVAQWNFPSGIEGYHEINGVPAEIQS
jgi:hypothetical protein